MNNSASQFVLYIMIILLRYKLKIMIITKINIREKKLCFFSFGLRPLKLEAIFGWF